MKLTTRTIGRCLTAAFVALFLGACSTANIGGIQNSRGVTLDFEELRLNPDLRYWYYNLQNDPYGVVGLERDYRIDDSPLWQPVAPDSPVLKKVVGLVRDFPVPGSSSAGFHITDPQGRVIGVWYSSLTAGITVDPATQRVSISTALPWVFSDDY
ncbi:MAG: hypothetical protein MUD16_03185 [Desulfobacterales bacterium]|jgi:hypothetical protein|nr:hypothetical protein [Desulfobacterales bacterium]